MVHICEALVVHICETLVVHICETPLVHNCETLMPHRQWLYSHKSRQWGLGLNVPIPDETKETSQRISLAKADDVLTKGTGGDDSYDVWSKVGGKGRGRGVRGGDHTGS